MIKNVDTLQVAMTITKRVIVLRLTGTITMGQGAQIFKEEVKKCLGAGCTRLLVDLKDVRYVDSTGLSTLVGAFIDARNLGGNLKLLKPSKKIHDLLSITKLLSIFDVFEDEDTALESFS